MRSLVAPIASGAFPQKRLWMRTPRKLQAPWLTHQEDILARALGRISEEFPRSSPHHQIKMAQRPKDFHEFRLLAFIVPKSSDLEILLSAKNRRSVLANN
jgi:hypothetical protein